MPVPAVLAWRGRSFIYLRQLVQKRGEENQPLEKRVNVGISLTVATPLAFFRHV